MHAKNSDSSDVLTIRRRGSIDHLQQERRGNGTHLDSRRNAFQSQLPPVSAKVMASESAARTRGEIEADICVGINRFQQEILGRGPQDIRTHLIADIVLVRLSGVMTPAERQLVNGHDAEKGCNLVKQVRTQLVESARPVLKAIVEKVTGVQMISLHHDLSTASDEEVIVFTLVAVPGFREGRSAYVSH